MMNLLLSQSLFNYDFKKLIVMLKLEPRTVGLKPTKIGHVDRVIVTNFDLPGI